MTTFYICRHGETENNRDQKLAGWLDSPLTERGLENVQATLVKLKGIEFDRIQTSDLGRAVVTAELIAKGLSFSGEIIHSKALREVNYGDWGGMSYKEAISQFPRSDKATDFAPPNGESLRDMQTRVVVYLHSLNKSSPEQTILLSAHDGTIKAIYAAFAGIDVGQHDADHEYPHDFVAKFTMDDTITSFTEV
jgi:broad specificity phosphatase PhoE